MSIEKKKSPWAYGKEAEKELGAEETQKIHDSHRRRVLAQEIKREIRKGRDALREEQDPEKKKELRRETGRAVFRKLMEMKGSTVQEAFVINRESGLVVVNKLRYFMLEDPTKPLFLVCAPGRRHEDNCQLFSR